MMTIKLWLKSDSASIFIFMVLKLTEQKLAIYNKKQTLECLRCRCWTTSLTWACPLLGRNWGCVIIVKENLGKRNSYNILKQMNFLKVSDQVQGMGGLTKSFNSKSSQTQNHKKRKWNLDENFCSTFKLLARGGYQSCLLKHDGNIVIIVIL